MDKRRRTSSAILMNIGSFAEGQHAGTFLFSLLSVMQDRVIILYQLVTQYVVLLTRPTEMPPNEASLLANTVGLALRFRLIFEGG